jgi:acetyl esterase/lipase
VIIYLPSLPRALSEGYGINDSAIVSALSAASHATIAQINYRSGPLSPYPTPVHDVLTGYDYVKSRFSQDLNPWTTTTRSGRVKKPHLRIGVCGQLVGGSLAAMLGLTESRIAQDRVAAVAAHAPLTDWVFPERVQTLEDALLGTGDGENDAILGKTARRKRKSKARLPSWEEFSDGDGGLSTCNLQVLREQLFKKPANYFDPFASPVHFFRSPSANVPGSPIDTASERETISEGEDPLSALSLSPPGKPRKAHRKFPPSNSTLLLPSFRLSTGTTTPLADMNEEFVKLLRRSVVRSVLARADTQALLDRFEEESLDRDERLELAVSEAERRVEYHVNEGGGLWGLGEKWRGEVEAVGRWFGGVLG